MNSSLIPGRTGSVPLTSGSATRRAARAPSCGRGPPAAVLERSDRLGPLADLSLPARSPGHRRFLLLTSRPRPKETRCPASSSP